ncbi:MAG: porin family protein [Cyclobacteriaceae bacterium]|jgi:hypothetical protein
MFLLARRFVLFLFFIGGFMLPVFSQATCEETLNQAATEFDAGRFYSLPAVLKTCLEGGFTADQRFRAFYLLAQAYLVLDDPIAAEDSYLKLLRENPEFVPNEKSDPIDLVYLSRKFTTRPKFTPHVRIGANLSIPRVIYELNTFSSGVSINRSLKVGIPQLGIGVDWNLSDNWSIGAEVNYAPKIHSETITNIARDDKALITDRSAWLDFPILVKYSDDSGRWRPFGYAGFALNLLLSNSASYTFSDFSPSLGNSIKPAEGPDEDLAYKRNFLNRSLVIGGGVKYKIGKNYIYADARYMIGLSNLTIPEKNYYQADGITLASTVTQYQYTSDFFRLDNLAISVGYVRPIYDPRKIKRPSAKGFLRTLFRPKGKSK